MRSKIFISFFCSAIAAAVFSLSMSGCNGNSSSIPGPTLAPTQCPTCFSEYQIPTANATPVGIALGPDNNLWFTELNGDKVGSVTPTGAFTEYPLAGGANPIDMVSGPNNSLWFTESGTSQIGEISTTGTIHNFNTTTGGAGPEGLAVDPTNTNHLWFGESITGEIGMITAGGAVTEYPLGIGGSSPVAVTVTSDGTVWFLDDGTNTLGKLTLPGPSISEYAMPVDANLNQVSGLADITVGPDGNVWFTALGTDDVCQALVSVSPPTISCAIPPSDISLNTVPFGIVSDPSRDVLWFAELAAGQIANITPSGTITEFGINGSGTTAVEVAMGPDTVGGSNTADVWFTNGGLLGITGIGTNDIGQAHLSQFASKPLAKTYAQFKTHVRRLTVDRRSLATRHVKHG